MPEEECLAYAEENGAVKLSDDYYSTSGLLNYSLLSSVGFIDSMNRGDTSAQLGGAAAFIATFYNYNFNCIFSDYFLLDADEFSKKYPRKNMFE